MVGAKIEGGFGREVVVEIFNFSAKILLQGILDLFIYLFSVRDPKLESVQLQFVGGVFVGLLFQREYTMCCGTAHGEKL